MLSIDLINYFLGTSESLTMLGEYCKSSDINIVEEKINDFYNTSSNPMCNLKQLYYKLNISVSQFRTHHLELLSAINKWKISLNSQSKFSTEKPSDFKTLPQNVNYSCSSSTLSPRLDFNRNNLNNYVNESMMGYQEESNNFDASLNQNYMPELRLCPNPLYLLNDKSSLNPSLNSKNHYNDLPCASSQLCSSSVNIFNSIKSIAKTENDKVLNSLKPNAETQTLYSNGIMHSTPQSLLEEFIYNINQNSFSIREVTSSHSIYQPPKLDLSKNICNLSVVESHLNIPSKKNYVQNNNCLVNQKTNNPLLPSKPDVPYSLETNNIFLKKSSLCNNNNISINNQHHLAHNNTSQFDGDGKLSLHDISEPQYFVSKNQLNFNNNSRPSSNFQCKPFSGLSENNLSRLKSDISCPSAQKHFTNNQTNIEINDLNNTHMYSSSNRNNAYQIVQSQPIKSTLSTDLSCSRNIGTEVVSETKSTTNLKYLNHVGSIYEPGSRQLSESKCHYTERNTFNASEKNNKAFNAFGNKNQTTDSTKSMSHALDLSGNMGNIPNSFLNTNHTLNTIGNKNDIPNSSINMNQAVNSSENTNQIFNSFDNLSNHSKYISSNLYQPRESEKEFKYKSSLNLLEKDPMISLEPKTINSVSSTHLKPKYQMHASMLPKYSEEVTTLLKHDTMISNGSVSNDNTPLKVPCNSPVSAMNTILDIHNKNEYYTHNVHKLVEEVNIRLRDYLDNKNNQLHSDSDYGIYSSPNSKSIELCYKSKPEFIELKNKHSDYSISASTKDTIDSNYDGSTEASSNRVSIRTSLDSITNESLSSQSKIYLYDSSDGSSLIHYTQFYQLENLILKLFEPSNEQNLPILSCLYSLIFHHEIINSSKLDNSQIYDFIIFYISYVAWTESNKQESSQIVDYENQNNLPYCLTQLYPILDLISREKTKYMKNYQYDFFNSAKTQIVDNQMDHIFDKLEKYFISNMMSLHTYQLYDKFISNLNLKRHFDHLQCNLCRAATEMDIYAFSNQSVIEKFMDIQIFRQKLYSTLQFSMYHLKTHT